MSDNTKNIDRNQLAEVVASLDDISQKLDASGHTADAEVVLSIAEELLDKDPPDAA